MSQGSPLRVQPWAILRNPFGVFIQRENTPKGLHKIAWEPARQPGPHGSHGSQGSPLRVQPWAILRNPFGVEIQRINTPKGLHNCTFRNFLAFAMSEAERS